MNIAFTINFTGTPDADDVLGARHIVFQENVRRAALVPPGVVLPTSTPAEIKTGYLAVLAETITSAHVSYIQQAKSAGGIETRFTPAQLETMRANLVARLNAGETAAAVVADTAA